MSGVIDVEDGAPLCRRWHALPQCGQVGSGRRWPVEGHVQFNVVAGRKDGEQHRVRRKSAQHGVHRRQDRRNNLRRRAPWFADRLNLDRQPPGRRGMQRGLQFGQHAGRARLAGEDTPQVRGVPGTSLPHPRAGRVEGAVGDPAQQREGLQLQQAEPPGAAAGGGAPPAPPLPPPAPRPTGSPARCCAQPGQSRA
jgi:hypothetical protein